MIISFDTSTSIEKAVGASSVRFGLAMASGLYYAFCSSVACWIAQGATPTASAASGSMFVPPNTIIVINGSLGADLAVIEDSSGGKACLTRALTF